MGAKKNLAQQSYDPLAPTSPDHSNDMTKQQEQLFDSLEKQYSDSVSRKETYNRHGLG